MEFLGITPIGWVSITVALSMAVLAGLMFILGTKRIHFLWGIFSLITATWSGTFYAVALAHAPEVAMFWWKITYISIILIPFVFLHFVLEFTENVSFKKTPLSMVLLYTVALALLFFHLTTNLITDGVRFSFNELYYTLPGVIHPYFTASYVALVFYAHYLVYREYKVRRDDTLFRSQARYFFLGTAIGFTGASMNFFPVYGVDIHPITNLAVIIGVSIVGFAILRYRLFNIRVVTAQLLTLVLVSFSVIRIYVSTSAGERIFNILLLVVTLAVGVYLILSVRKEVQQRERIEKLAKELGETNERQEKLIHFIGHEVKGYLTDGEYALAAMVQGDFGVMAKETGDVATAALAKMRKGVDTVQDILRASDIKKGTMKFVMKPVELGGIVREAMAKLKPDADKKKLNLEIKIDSGVQFMANIDAVNLGEHVIRNLIDNSIKYTDAGSVTVGLAKRDGKIIFTVKDTGRGITKEDMAILFTEGGRGADSLKVNVHSTGYGLFIAKGIVDAHGGKIWAESEGSGKGSTFFVELPAISQF